MPRLAARSLVALAAIACAHLLPACGGAPAKHAATETKSWEPPDTFDDVPRAPGATAAVDSSDPPQPAAVPGPAPGAPAGATVSIERRPMIVGSTVDVTASMGIQTLFTVEAGDKTVTVEDYEGSIDHHTVQVLGAHAQAATKVRVAFVDKSVTRIVNGREKRTESPVRGKSYVLEAKPEGLAITDPDGHDVPPEEGKQLAQLFRGLGAGDALTRAIPSEPMRVGADVPAMAEGLQQDFARALDGRVFFGKVSVAPTGTRHVAAGDCVAFAVVLQVGFETRGRKVRMDFKGELLLRASDGAPNSLDLGGAVAVDLEEHGVPAHGEGKSRFTGTYVYP